MFFLVMAIMNVLTEPHNILSRQINFANVVREMQANGDELY